jgi:hypothetical protein
MKVLDLELPDLREMNEITMKNLKEPAEVNEMVALGFKRIGSMTKDKANQVYEIYPPWGAFFFGKWIGRYVEVWYADIKEGYQN